MRPTRRWGKWLLLAALLVALAMAGAWWWSLPARGDAFYTAPADASAAPGTLLRSARYMRGVPVGARAWRIVYATRDARGAPVPASALVLAPATGGGFPVVAWAHGTTGATTGCAPALLDAPFANVPAFPQALTQGWAVVATDYMGMATPGGVPYLVGAGEAHAVLDAVRAARQLEGLSMALDTVVWGHSQGGHAALWTGARWRAYAPELRVRGIAAAAPATDLPVLLGRIAHEPVGRIMGSYVLHAYAQAYADVDPHEVVRPNTRWLSDAMAARCLAGRKALVLVAQAMAAGGSTFEGEPARGAFGRRLQDNVPPPVSDVPVWIAQGDRDALVLPEVQRGYVHRWRQRAPALEYREYPGEDHLSLVRADSAYSRDLLAWTRARFAQSKAHTHD